VGRATRLASSITFTDKVYRARATLAFRSPTGDMDSEPASRYSGAAPSRDAVLESLLQFKGPILQVPHRFSALRVDGKRAYERARAGESFNLDPRPVTVHALDLEEYEFPEVQLRVSCSAGTYIRSLVEDIGTALGTGGCLLSLERIQVGSLDETDAMTPFECVSRYTEERLWDSRIPWSRLFPDARTVHLDGTGFSSEQLQGIRQDVSHGRRLDRGLVCGADTSEPERTVSHADPGSDIGQGSYLLIESGDLLAIYGETGDGSSLKPYRVLIND